ncbi:alpha/beta hydrolase [Arthrobacter sp. P2b]|uniref:alpha/beta hydrolase n=1 Tax=Arthrobacter sp. P2b TaxID=1938741 RepID=UPI0009A8D83C|nr:alpha/beta hydrolase [Arthrobacter sp. P2b]SLK10531.1 acetyl esterase [Arthrobacter sp. P2b]
MDEELYDLLASMAAAGRRPVSDGTPQQARDQLAARRQGPSRGLHGIYDCTATAGGCSVPVRIYNPEPNPVGVIVYVHGGGWVIGNIESFDNVARDLAYHGGARVVSVDYGLAPENPFPSALNEVQAAIQWAAAEFPGEPLVVAGDSAGGNLATVAVRKLRQQGVVNVAGQALIYPVTDSDFSRSSYQEIPPVPTLLSRQEMEWFWNHYLPDSTLRTHPDVAPLHAESLNDLPFTILVLAGYDPLRDEGLAYAKELRSHGVPVDLRMYEGLCHGFFGLAQFVSQAQDALRDTAVAIGNLLRTGRVHHAQNGLTSFENSVK